MAGGRRGDQFPAREGRQRHEENQQRVRRGDAALLHRLQAKRIGKRRAEAHLYTAESSAPCQDKPRRPRRGQERRQSRGEGVLAEDSVGRRLAPVDQRRLGVARRVIKRGHDEVAALEHLAARLGEARFVAVEQRQQRGLRQRKRQHGEEKHEAQPPVDRRGGSGWRRVQVAGCSPKMGQGDKERMRSCARSGAAFRRRAKPAINHAASIAPSLKLFTAWAGRFSPATW